MDKKKKHLLIILIAGIGDMVVGSRAVRALRNGFPDADIHLLTSTEASVIAEEYPFIDHIWSFPIRELRTKKSNLIKILKLIRVLRKIHFDIVINLYKVCSWQGALKMGAIFLLLKSQLKIGHNHKGFGLFLNKKAPAQTFEKGHIADAMMKMAVLAGGKSDKKGIEVHFDKKSQQNWEHLFVNDITMQAQKMIGINPGADNSKKRWHPDNYARVARRLIECTNAKIIILGGPGEENIADYIQEKIQMNCVNLGGKLNLKELVYVISRLNLLITNDSCPMHIAAAVQTPVAAIFGPENPEIYGPYCSTNLCRVIYKNIPCRPCCQNNCLQPFCVNSITPDEVLESSLQLLGN